MRLGLAFELLISLIITLAATLLLAQAWTIRAPANVFPLGVLFAMGGLAAANSLRVAVALSSRRNADPAIRGQGSDWLRVAILFVALFAYALLLPLGFVPATFAMLFSLYLVFANDITARVVVQRLALAAALSVGAFIGFRHYLGVDLPTTGWFGVF